MASAVSPFCLWVALWVAFERFSSQILGYFPPRHPPHPQKQEHMVLRRVSKFFSEKKHQAGEPGGSLDPANYLFSDLGDQLAGRKTIKYNDIFLFKFLIFLIQFGGSLVVGYQCLRLFKQRREG